MKKVIRVLLVDDHAILREGLRALLSHYSDVEIIGEAEDGYEAVEKSAKLQPDIVIMDIALPKLSGIEATRMIRQQNPQIKVLVLTQYNDWRYIQPLLLAGADGYVTKRAVGNDLITAIRTVSCGETYLQPSVASKIAEHIRMHTSLDSDLVGSLTPREREILRHIVSGRSNPQIAALLSLSVKTVEWHRTNLMNKLGAHSVADLVRLALQYGLVSDDPNTR